MTVQPDTFLAVDAGNSKTVAVLTDRNGRVLGRGRGGNGDIYGADSVEQACSAVFGAIELALSSSGVVAENVVSAAFRLAGVDYEEDAEFWDERVRSRFGSMWRWSIKNDGFASLRLLDGTGVGVSITVGTGPAVAARSADGREECSGMFVFHNLGGGGLGDRARDAVVLAWQGLAPATLLTEELCTYFRVTDPWELRHAFTRRFGARPHAELRQASRLVLEVAERGDDVARRIVADQATAFAGYAQWCARRVGTELASGELPVLLSGSVVTSEHPAMREALRRELATVAPAAPVSVAAGSPVHGAVLDALAEGGIAIDPELMARVVSDHAEGFLDT